MTNVETKLIVPSAIEKYLNGERIILELKVTTVPPIGNKIKAPTECTATFTFSGAHPAIMNPKPGTRFVIVRPLAPVFLNK